MRKILMCLGIAAGLVLAGSPAEAATTVERGMSFEATLEECGEIITLSGTVAGIFTEQALGDSGFLLTFHFQPQGVTGTSSSRAIYHGTGLGRETIVVVPSGGVVDTFINRFHIVGTGGAPTFYVRETVHLTVTPSGEITASVDNFSLGVCRGRARATTRIRGAPPRAGRLVPLSRPGLRSDQAVPAAVARPVRGGEAGHPVGRTVFIMPMYL